MCGLTKKRFLRIDLTHLMQSCVRDIIPIVKTKPPKKARNFYYFKNMPSTLSLQRAAREAEAKAKVEAAKKKAPKTKKKEAE